MSNVTQILSQIEQGDAEAAEKLLPLVYDELRKLAAQKMALENPGQTLQATALVHEAYVRLVGAKNTQKWSSRGHFFGAAAEAMRRILVDSARRKNTAKRGRQRQRDSVDIADIAVTNNPDELLEIHDALEGLAEVDPESAQLVKLRYFVGLTAD